jgi:hypothetical protein
MKRLNTSLAIFLFLATFASAQNVNDAGMWNAFSFSADVKDLTPWKDLDFFKSMSVNVNPEIRFNENISKVSGYFTDLGLEKKWSKFLSTNVEYRIGGRREETWFNLRRRWSFGGQVSIPIERFKFSSTTRYQVANNISSDVDLNSTWRQKLGVEYSLKKDLSVQVSHELFFRPVTLENSDWRSQFVLKYKVNKSNAFSLGYLIQRNLGNADMDFVIVSGYKWEFNKKKEKSTPAGQ